MFKSLYFVTPFEKKEVTFQIGCIFVYALVPKMTPTGLAEQVFYILPSVFALHSTIHVQYDTTTNALQSIRLSPLLFLSRTIRTAIMSELREYLVITLQVTVESFVRYSLVRYEPDDEDDVLTPVHLPYAWSVSITTPIVKQTWCSIVHPCHLLWSDTLAAYGNHWRQACVTDCVTIFRRVYDNSSTEYDANQWLFYMELCSSIDILTLRAILPMEEILHRMTTAHTEYVHWSYRRGTRRLGIACG